VRNDGQTRSASLESVSRSFFSDPIPTPCRRDANTVECGVSVASTITYACGIVIVMLLIAVALTSRVSANSVSVAGDGGLPRLLTELRLNNESYSVRPPVVGFTGDGSGFLGGPDGNGSSPSSPRFNLGHFRWTVWSAREARGSGVEWVRTCWTSRCKSWFVGVPATARAFAPMGGRFTRLTIITLVGNKCRRDAYLTTLTGITWANPATTVAPARSGRCPNAFGR
jgi:hypothetical protein